MGYLMGPHWRAVLFVLPPALPGGHHIPYNTSACLYDSSHHRLLFSLYLHSDGKGGEDYYSGLLLPDFYRTLL